MHAVDTPFAVTPTGRRLYVLPGDRRGQQLVESGVLNPGTVAAWSLLLRQSGWTHLFDVGANYGEMLLAADLPRAARCVAIEPNPSIRRMLSRSIAEAEQAVDVVPYAISDRAGTAVLNVDPDWSGTSSLLANPEHRPTTPIDVHCVTLGMLFDAAGVTPASGVLVKIDVEGHEAAVLRGALAWLGRLARFAGLVEILHMSDADRQWLLDTFDVGLYDTVTDRVVQVGTRDVRGLRALSGAGLYGQDAIITIASSARGFHTWR